MKKPAMSKIIDNFKHLFYNTPLHFLTLCIESTNKPLPQTFYHKSSARLPIGKKYTLVNRHKYQNN